METSEFWLRLSKCIQSCTGCPAAETCTANNDDDWNVEDCAKSLKECYYRCGK